MAELYLVRHGQASFGSGNYDLLSEVGERQAVWLGEYFSQRDAIFDRVITGTMRRHRQTLDGIIQGLGRTVTHIEQHAGLDEYDFHALFEALGPQHGALKALRHGSKNDFFKGLRQVLQLWSEDGIDGPIPEAWASFQRRVSEARRAIQDGPGKRVLAVTSGGVMAVMAQQALRSPADTAIALNMQISNSSFCRFFFNERAWQLGSFNSDPHLDRVDRRRYQTYA
ncbi:histidine phosphatase family protein [Paraburkholderia sp. MM5384-R2]|uniref:histidine phosphatase family protein n=1 Tax=Paraburkholderia sp. MM5384-R2 TaxID=2723097 RepID=UPI001607B0B5|nr:histidine phosphatase family protein [Paraburkholderia sp. MM5384-R2]MBB5503522.1 broad specificity phosphatase PhoE [Paraburkholderia sp. MM5384-R2]